MDTPTPAGTKTDAPVQEVTVAPIALVLPFLQSKERFVLLTIASTAGTFDMRL